MSTITYSLINPERINHDFIGVAKKYYSFKRKRQSIEKERNNLLINLNYKLSVDKTLSKNIQDQKERLRIAQTIHTRRMQDSQQKKMNDTHQQFNKNHLNRVAQQLREQTIENIRQAKLSVEKSRKNKRRISSIQYEKIKQTLRVRQDQTNQYNKNQFQMIKRDELVSKNSVNMHYKTINKLSLSNYQTLIDEQSFKCQEYEKDIQKFKQQMSKVQKRIDKKKDVVYQIIDEITEIKQEAFPTSPGKFLPLYLRSTQSNSKRQQNDSRSVTSRSSRPRDILLKSERPSFSQIL